MWYQTNLVRVRAKQFTGDVEEIQSWLEDNELSSDGFQPVYGNHPEDPEIVAEVWDELHSSWVGVYLYNWIIIGTEGETYPCKDEVFRVKYSEYKKPDSRTLIARARIISDTIRHLELALDHEEMSFDKTLEELSNTLVESLGVDKIVSWETALCLIDDSMSLEDLENANE